MAGEKKAANFAREDKAAPVSNFGSTMPLLLVLAIALAVTYFLSGYLSVSSRGFSSSFYRRPAVSATQLENSYHLRLTAIVSDYLARVSAADQNLLAETEQLKNRLLALIVPAKYRDRHLALVLAVDKLETATKNGDSQAAAQEMETIRQNSNF